MSESPQLLFAPPQTHQIRTTARTAKGSAGIIPAALISLVAAAIFSWHVGRPGVWADEAATIVACRRSLAELFQLSGNLDLVHLAYYVMARTVWQVDASVGAIRLISVLAMSLTAGTLVLIGRRLGSARIGVLTGLLFAVNPFASRYAQEARPSAMVTLLAAVSTYVLLSLLAGSRRRTQVAYGLTLALVGLFNVMGLMLVLPHAVYAWWVGDRSARFRWAIAATGGLVAIAPFVLTSFTQRGQVSWIERPRLYDARALVTMEFGSRIAPAVVILALILAIAAARFFGGSGELAEDQAPDDSSPGPTPARAAIVLGAAWALVPPIVLFAVSQILPMWTIHYLLFSLPGLTLLLAALVPGLDRMSTFGTAIACTLSVLLVGALGVPDQITNRDPVSGHGEDLLGVANYVGEGKKPGDAVFYTPAELRMLTEVSPEHMASLADFSLASTPLQAANLEGIPLDVEDLPRVLLPFQRVWMIEGLYKHPEVPGMQTEAPALIAAEFHEVRKLTITDVQVTLYARNAAVKPAVRSATSHRPVQSNARRGKRR